MKRDTGFLLAHIESLKKYIGNLFLRLDTSNGPLTGDLEISKEDPISKLTDTGDSRSTWVTRSDTNSLSKRINQIGDSGALPDTYKLLIHCDGADGSTTFTDSTDNAHTVTANGSAQVDTAIKKFGTGSLLLNGTTDYLSVGASNDWEFGSGDFTVGWWDYRTIATNGKAPISRDATTTPYVPWIMGYSLGGNALFFASSNGSSWDIASSKLMGSLSLNTWVYWEVGRSGNTFYLFKNGTLTTTWTLGSSLSFNANSNPLSIGKIQGSGYFTGQIDEIVVVKGTCLHTANFTPPTEPYAGDTRRNVEVWGSDDDEVCIGETGKEIDAAVRGENVEIEYEIEWNVVTGGNTVFTFDADGNAYFKGGDQDYKYTGRGDRMVVQGQTSGSDSILEIFSADGDGTDSTGMAFYANGTPEDVTNAEWLNIISNAVAGRYEFRVRQNGTGMLMPILFQADEVSEQLILNTDGTIGIGVDDWIYYGAGYDAGFKYDGTNLLVDPAIVGSGIFKYVAQPTFTNDEQIATKKYVDNSVASGVEAVIEIDHTDSPYTALSTDKNIFADTSGGDVTVNLPVISGNTGKIYLINNIESGTVTVVGDGTETINGELTQDISQDDAMMVIATSAEWRII